MKPGLPLSILAHIIVGASGLVFWTSASHAPVASVVNINLDGVELAETTNLSEIARPVPVEEEAPPPEPEVIEDVAEDEGEPPEAAQQEAPEAAPEDAIPNITDEPDPEPTPEVKPTPKPTPNPKPTKKPNTEKRTDKKKSDDPLADLFAESEDILSSVEKDRAGSKSRTAPQELKDQEQKPRKAAGEQTGNQAAVIDFIKAEIKRDDCWRSTRDLPDFERLDVTISFRLDAKGRIVKAPKRIRPDFVANSDIYMQQAESRAIRAINLCEPFELPEEDYALWQNEDINLTFDEAF